MNEILAEAHTILRTTPLRWASLAENLSEALIGEAPAGGQWSARDCLQHLVDTERWVFPVRIEALLAGQDFAAFDPDSQGTTSASSLPARELAAEFGSLRARSLALLERLTPSDLGRQARHQELGPVTLAELLHEWAGHDLMHTVQAERALMQPFIRGCGPWQSYFRDHAVNG